MSDFRFYERYPVLLGIKEQIEKAADMMTDCYKRGGKILVCGNGGSAADAEHISGELLKGFMSKRPVTKEERAKLEKLEGGKELADTLQRGIPAIPLVSLSAVNTAYANDCNAEYIYAQDVFALADEKDLLIGISTSGNSRNVVAALKVAKAFGIESIAMTGAKDSKSKEFATVTINVPETETYRVQELHLPVYHYLCQRIEEVAFE